MRVSGVHWAVFGLIMVLSVSVGIILSDKYLEKQYQKKQAKLQQ